MFFCELVVEGSGDGEVDRNGCGYKSSCDDGMSSNCSDGT